jgi:site-specific recombinase XerD
LPDRLDDLKNGVSLDDERADPHDLRHSFGSLLLDAGVPLASVSGQMGHDSTVITAQMTSTAQQCRIRESPR